jgi:hypothetical protein
MHDSALIFVPAATFGQLISTLDLPLGLLLRRRACRQQFASAADTWKEQISWPPGRIGRKIRLAAVQRLSPSRRSFALCQRLEDNPILFESRNYFGDRMLA